MLATVEIFIPDQVENVWSLWNEPKHIVHWYFASEEWCCPKAVNELRVEARINIRMEAKDGSFGFDFAGTYTHIDQYKAVNYRLDDRRQVHIIFESVKEGTLVTETFELEDVNTRERQILGWQSILNNFARYCKTQRKNLEANVIDDYINGQSQEVQFKLNQIRDYIRILLPSAIEKLSYKMPTYHLGKNIIHFAAHNKHIGLYPGPDSIETFKESLKAYKYSKAPFKYP